MYNKLIIIHVRNTSKSCVVYYKEDQPYNVNKVQESLKRIMFCDFVKSFSPCSVVIMFT